jgi:hypothetical protein
MDLRHDHGALIHVVRACDNADAPDLVAIGGENSVSVLLIVCATTLLYTRIYDSPSTRVIDRHVRRPSRLLSSRFPYHRPSLVPTRRFSLFIRSMVHRVKTSVRSMTSRVLIPFAGSPLHLRTLVYTYSQKHPMLTRISFLSVVG